MIENDKHPLSEEVVLFIKREAASETQGTLAGQALANQLPRRLVDGAQGAQVSAHELQAAAPIIKKIPDQALRNTVMSYFQITTKYQALNMLIAPQSRLRRAHPEILSELIEATTKTDRLTKGRVRNKLGNHA